jgi:release factor glutamine methyltransferase
VNIPAHEYQRLAAAVTGRGPGALALQPPDPDERDRIQRLVERRIAGEPLQYLEGTTAFGPLDLLIDRRSLIPRPETEQVWEECVASLRQAGPGTVIVDLGTGSGALALALKHAFPPAQVYGVDISEDAVSLARENALRTGLDVTFLHGDLFDPLPRDLMGRVDLVVSNPPYVADHEFEVLPPDVRDHEPRVALVSGPAGTEVLERIADEAFWWVGIGGWVICEIGETQGERIEALFSAFDREVRRDLTGRDRILVARKGASCCL